MRRWPMLGVFGVALLGLAPGMARGAVGLTVSELLESSSELAGKEVTLEGELIGDFGFRGDGWMWTQLNDDSYVSTPIREGGVPVGGNTGVGIRMPISLGVDLDPPGRYLTRGPIVRVTGIWKYHDEERQGESYLEVESLAVIEPGRQLDEGPNWFVIVLGVSLVGVAAVFWVTRIDE